jgi:hypothetical protein
MSSWLACHVLKGSVAKEQTPPMHEMKLFERSSIDTAAGSLQADMQISLASIRAHTFLSVRIHHACTCIVATAGIDRNSPW